MNILVTGAEGQLGKSLRKISGEYPYHNFIFTDLPEGDIADPGKIGRIVSEKEIALIVNCAAYTAVDRAESEPEAAWRVNAAGPAALAGIAAERGIKLVHISTDYVFSGSASEPYSEDDLPEPVGVYGRTKLEGEREICGRSVDVAIIRAAWLYSEFGNNFVKTMLRLAAEGKEPGVVNDQHGTPTYATNLARAIMKLIDNGIEGCRVYHYTDGGATTWYEFAKEIFALSGSPNTVKPVTSAEYITAARRPAYSVLDKSKIMDAGVSVPDWRESLRECMALLKPQYNI